MLGKTIYWVQFLLYISCWLAGCGSTPQPTDVPERIEVPIEVTRIVLQQETPPHILPTAIPPQPCAPTEPGESAVITIGAILPLSSPGAILAGFAMQTALNIAITDINEQGGIHNTPVRLVTYDSAGTPERSAQFTERLILLDCAIGIVGLYHNNDALAVIDVAHRYGTPVIIAEAGADDITTRQYPEVFRIAPAYGMLAQIPAQWLSEVGDYNNDGVISSAIIAENTSGLSATLIQAIHTNLTEAEIESDILRVSLPTQDYSSIIARLVAKERLPDAIFIALKGDSALRLQNQLLSAGIGPQRATLIVQHHVGLNSEQFWQAVPNGNGTIIARTGAWSTMLTERGQSFAVKYEQYMNRQPEPYAFATYDALTLLAETLRTAPSWQSNELIETLEQSNITITSGAIHFPYTSFTSEDADFPPYLWHQWDTNPLIYLQYTDPNQSSDDLTIIWPTDLRSPSLHTAVLPIVP